MGSNSYEVEVKEGYKIPTTATFLKPYMTDTQNYNPKPLFYHRRTIIDTEAAPDEGNVECILGHRVNASGKYEFKTKWEGYSEREATWEPINHFFHRYSAPLIKYGRERKWELNIFKYLSPEPMTQ